MAQTDSARDTPSSASLRTRSLSLLALLAALLPASLCLASVPQDPRSQYDPPDELGGWKVGYTHFEATDAARDDRLIPMDLWYPVDDEDWTGDFATYVLITSPFPLGPESEVAREDPDVSDEPGRTLLVFSHGFGGLALQSTPLMEHLASHGFVVVAPSHTGNTQDDMSSPDPAADRSPDVSFVIDHMLARNQDPGDALFGRLHPDAVGVLGHSYGGFTAMAVAGGYDVFPPDPRVKAIMAIAAYNTPLSDAEILNIDLPQLYLIGTLDAVISDPHRPYDLLNPQPDLFRADVHGANHTHFANICQIGNWLIGGNIPIEDWPAFGAGALVAPYLDTCVPPALPIEKALRAQNLYATALFRHYLRGNWGYYPFLQEAYAQSEFPLVRFFGTTGPAVPALPQSLHLVLLAAGLSGSAAAILRRRRLTPRDGRTQRPRTG